ncbi:MAG: DUF3240 family protein [Steroidobacteraceae bacterium]
MNNYDCQLTLAIPTALEEEVLDLLLAHPEWVTGFTLFHGEGFGIGSTLRSTLEKVRGRAQRTVITLLLQRVQLGSLIELLNNSFPSDEVSWWTSTVDGFGTLT